MSVSFSRLEEVTVRLSSYTVKLLHLSVIPSRPNLLNCATRIFFLNIGNTERSSRGIYKSSVKLYVWYFFNSYIVVRACYGSP